MSEPQNEVTEAEWRRRLEQAKRDIIASSPPQQPMSEESGE